MLRINVSKLVSKEFLSLAGGETKNRVIHQVMLSLADRIQGALGVNEYYDENRRLHQFSIGGMLLDEWEGEALVEFMERMDEEYRTTTTAMPVSPQDRLYNLLGGAHWKGRLADADA